MTGAMLLGVMSVSALANQVSIAWNYPGGSAVATEYNSSGTAFRTFQTFCLEDGEFYDPNYKYNFNVGTRVIYDQPLNAALDPAGGPLTTGAVNLYKAYMNGTLKNAGAVQEAIWYNQGYYNNTWATDLASINSAYSSLNTTYFDRTPFVDPTGYIKVMNLYANNNADNVDRYNPAVNPQRQSFIYVPDGGMTISMLGFGFIGLGMLRRKMS